MIISLDNRLKVLPLRDYAKKDFLCSNSDYKKDYRTGKETQTLYHVSDTLKGDAIHSNYLEYLELCWAKHYGVVLTPDIIWYTILCEVALIIAEHPEKFRYLFTDSADKEEISVRSDSDTILPLDSIMTQLRSRIPNGLADTFIMEFTTTTPNAREASYAAFADAVSPYYSYSMYSCGIPSVDIRGTENDWLSIVSSLQVIKNIFNVHDAYLYKISIIVSKLLKVINSNPDSNFVKDIFRVERCGSGGQTEIYGWFSDLFRVQPKSARFSRNFSTHISNVKYKNLWTDRSFQMKQGLFYSTIVDGTLEPDFGRIVYEVKGGTP